GQTSQWGRVEVYNESDSSPVKVFFYVTNITGGACAKVNLEVRTGHAGTLAGETAMTIHSGNIYDFNGAGNRKEVTGPGRVFNPTLPVNTTAVVTQRAQLDLSADNAQMNSSCTWDEIFVAETP